MAPHLLGPWLVALLGAGDPVVAEPAPELGASTGTDTGAATTGATGTTTTGTTGATTGTGTSGGSTSAGTGETTAGTAGMSTSNGTSSDGSSESSATAVTSDPTGDDATMSDGGSFVDGDITGISYGPEDFIEDGCDPDDEDVGCCDSAENNSDNFCHISRVGRDRVAIAVLLILLARPRRPRR